jgi:hypothetical protein
VGSRVPRQILRVILYEGKLAPQDLVEAYVWSALAAQAPIFDVARTAGRTTRDAAALKMTADQIREGQRRVAAFKPETAAPRERPTPRVADQLELKGILGRPPKRLALINSESLGEGESAEIKLANRTVVVRCLEIRESSVVVTISGEEERRVLQLGVRD